MATNYPAGLDNLTNPVTTDPVNSPSHAVQHANANDAIEALQAKVGTDNSLVTTSIDYRVRQLEANPVGTANKITQLVINNTGSTLAKGKVVYASGSVGASGQLRVSLSSNAAESTSSKTFGVLAEQIIQGGQGTVVCEGLLENIDTTGANDGDPIWLGTNGSMIFGLANKPVAPAHLVFVGIVVRGGNANNGSIFVKIQNGFELDELHTVLLSSLADKDLLTYDSATGLWKNKTFTTLDIPTKTYVDTALSNLSNTVTTDYVPISDVGNPDGVASLDSTGKIPLAQMGNLVAGAPTALDTLNELAAALGNNPNYATDITTALGTKVSKNGGDVITSSLPSVVGLTIKGATSQTADLQQWQLPNSTTVASMAATTTGSSTNGVLKLLGAYGGIISNGEWRIQRDGGALSILSPNGLNINSVYGGTTLTVQSNSGQTANITEWKNSAGTVLAKVDASGNIGIGAGTNSLNYGLDIFTGSMRVWNGVTGAGQTGTIYLGDGSFSKTYGSGWTFNGGITTNNEIYITGGTLHLGDGYLTKTSGNPFIINSGFWVNGAWLTVGGSNINYNNSLTVYSGSSTRVGAVIQGASSQTANLQEWQNSSGTILASIGSNGAFYSNVTNSATALLSILQGGTTRFEINQYGQSWNSTSSTFGTYYNTDGGTLPQVSIFPVGASNKGLIIRGYVSQTANLQEWQNSAGTVLAQIDAAGNAVFNNASTTNNINAFYGKISANTQGSGFLGQISAIATSASTIGMVIRGAASQTANLQEWQNSSGTVLAKVNATGDITAQNIALTTYGGIYGVGSYMTLNPGDTRIVSSGLSVSNASVGTSAQLQVTNGVASTVAVIVKAAASQTADLQQWVDSAGTVLAKIDASGNISIGSGISTSGSVLSATGLYSAYAVGIGLSRATGNANLAVSTGSTTNVGILVRGTGFQTANLQEWQNSSGTVLSRIQADGSIRSRYFGDMNDTTPYIDFSSNKLTVNTRNASYVGLVVQGAASQSANLQEWQNSSGTVLAKITSTGAFDATAITINGQPIPTGLTSSTASSNITLSSNYKYFVDTTAVRTLTLPASPVLGDEIQIFDASNSAGTNNVTINSNSGKINGSVQNAIIDVNGAAVSFVYTGSTYGWRMG